MYLQPTDLRLVLIEALAVSSNPIREEPEVVSQALGHDIKVPTGLFRPMGHVFVQVVGRTSDLLAQIVGRTADLFPYAFEIRLRRHRPA